MNKSAVLRGLLVAASLATTSAGAMAETASKQPSAAAKSLFQTCVDSSKDMPAFRRCLADHKVPKKTIDAIVAKMVAAAAEMDRIKARFAECSAIANKANSESSKGHVEQSVKLRDAEAACWERNGEPLLANNARKLGQAERDADTAHRLIHRRDRWESDDYIY